MAGRLKGVRVETASTREQALQRLQVDSFGLLILDESLPGALSLLRELQGLELKIIFCAHPHHKSAFLKTLIGELGVDEVLSHPVDPEELVRRAGSALSPMNQKVEPSSATSRRMQEQLEKLWQQFGPQNRERVVAIRRVLLEDLKGYQLDPEELRELERDAHKLIGSLGTFGLRRAAELSRELEHQLQEVQRGEPLDAEQLLDLGRELEDEVRRAPTLGQRVAQANGPTAPSPEGAAAPSGSTPSPRVLLVSERKELLGTLMAPELAELALDVSTAPVWRQARECWLLDAPDLVLVDLSGRQAQERLLLVEDLGRRLTNVPVLLLVDRKVWAEPATQKALNGLPVLLTPVAPADLAGAISDLLSAPSRPVPKALILDDDPQLVAALETILTRLKIDCHGFSNPLEFWDRLEEEQPNVVIVDLDMPYLSGLEICRGLRASPRWHRVPVLVLSSSHSSDTIHRIFTAGADEFVRKPFSGPELAARVLNRLVLAAPARRPAAPSRALGSGLADLRPLVEKSAGQGRRLPLALISLADRAALTAQHGAPPVAEALRILGLRLASRLGEVGTVLRWRPGELLAVLPGQTVRTASPLLQSILSDPRLGVITAGERTLELKVRVGLTAAEGAGSELFSALRQAERNVELAAAADRTVWAEETERRSRSRPAEEVQVLLLEPDEGKGRRLESLLRARGFHCGWSGDPEGIAEELLCDPPLLHAEAVFVSSDALYLLQRLGPLCRMTRVVAAVNNEEELVAAFDAGAFDCLVKPCRLPTLLKRLERAVER